MPSPLVFVHGIRLNGACWVQQRRLLGDHHITCPDLPGHGSRRGRERFSLDAAVEVVAAALDAAAANSGASNGAVPAVLVGHSLGGYVAIATAERYPEKVRTLIIAGATLRPNMLLRRLFRSAAGVLALRDSDRISAALLRRMVPTEIAEPVIAAGIATEVIPDVMEVARTFDPIDSLRSYSGRTLLINGRHDHFRLRESAFEAAAANGSLLIIPGGHYAPMTHGPAFAELVRRAAGPIPTPPVADSR